MKPDHTSHNILPGQFPFCKHFFYTRFLNVCKTELCFQESIIYMTLIVQVIKMIRLQRNFASGVNVKQINYLI